MTLIAWLSIIVFVLFILAFVGFCACVVSSKISRAEEECQRTRK